MAAVLLSMAAFFVVPELFGFKLTSEHFQWIAIIWLTGSSNLLWSRQPTTWKKKFLDKLIWAKPIEPAHQRPTIEVRNPPYGYDPAFFELTKDYVDVTNGSLSYESKWRLQEMEDTLLRIGHWDGPHHGRRYKIFHAQQEAGVVEFYGLGLSERRHLIDVHLDWVRFFSADSVRNFLRTVASQLCSATHDDWAATMKQIDTAMFDVAWNAMQFSPIHNLPSSLNHDPGELDVSFSGDYTVSVNRRKNARRAHRRSADHSQ
jgi:hypothetical protein